MTGEKGWRVSAAGTLIALGIAGVASSWGSPARAAPPAAGCFPDCRSGFLCSSGTCVSACNPPCSSGDVCTGQGECVDPEREERLASIHRHDGLFVRLALGVGYLTGTRKDPRGLEVPDPNRFGVWNGIAMEGAVNGVAEVGALMIGGTPAPGLVIGGGGWGVNVLSPTYEGDAATSYEHLLARGSFATDLVSTSILGPFVVWYPDSKTGFHAELSLGFALAISGDEADVDSGFDVESWDTAGWGTVLGAGYDFWVGQQWSLGLLGRVSYVSTTGRDDTFTALVPAFAATATCH